MTYYTRQGRFYVEAFPFRGLDVEIVIMGAVRYALGRSSYSPGCVMDFCKDHWNDLAGKTHKIVMRDVLEWLGQRHEWVKEGEHDSARPEAWRDFLRWCYANDKEAAKFAAEVNKWQRDRLQGVDEFFEVLK